MSMLAGPRRKQKVINLRAKNNAWSNDSSKFGQRMLEKMGWSEGKGLGAKENGIVEHVVARYKNDDKGLGFDDRNDQWTKHEDDFNALLANLSNGENNDEKLHSGVSLEHKSKKSKARVHYHKFTRGKDLTRYSEKDLANIFGKKTLKNEEKVQEPVLEEVKNTEQIFTEKGSMEDYFKNKLVNFKSKSKVISQSDEYYNENDCVFKGFSGTFNSNPESEDDKSCELQHFSFYTKINQSIGNTKTNNDSEDEKRKKSKKKKSQDQVLDMKQHDNNIETNHNVDVDHQIIMDHNQEIEYEKPKKSKKKKQKKKSLPILQEEEKIEIITAEKHINDYVPKKKKKRKNKE